MTIIDSIIKIIPGSIIEKIHYSRFQGIARKLYNLAQNRGIRTYTIFDKILIEVDPSALAERAIPFNSYETRVTKKLLERIKEGGIVFEVGAWIGYFTVLAANKVGNSGKVIAIEPSKENIQRIKKNIQLNNFTNVTVIESGVGEKSYNTSIKKEGPSSSTFKVSSDGDNSVKIEKIDSIMDNLKISKVDFLVMDIEGYEYNALKGMSNSLSKQLIENMIIEVHPELLIEFGSSENEVIQLLKENKYDVSIMDKEESITQYHILAEPVK